jgi:hypothetical protein
MEPLWSPVVATCGNRSQMGHARKPPYQAKIVAAGCDQLPCRAHGKEGVDGSSPSEGSAKAAQTAAFSIERTCTNSSVQWMEPFMLLQLEEGDILDLRYQLLHRTAAAILEAQRFAAHYALMLVTRSAPKTPGSTTTKPSRSGWVRATPTPMRSSSSASAAPSSFTSAGFAARSATRARSDSGRLPVRLPGSRGEAGAVFGVPSD